MKYYRVIKDNFLWEVGAILRENDNDPKGYVPVEDIWNKLQNQTEYISIRIIENNPEYFERVYQDNLDKMIFKTKEQIKETFNKFIK